MKVPQWHHEQDKRHRSSNRTTSKRQGSLLRQWDLKTRIHEEQGRMWYVSCQCNWPPKQEGCRERMRSPEFGAPRRGGVSTWRVSEGGRHSVGSIIRDQTLDVTLERQGLVHFFKKHCWQYTWTAGICAMLCYSYSHYQELKFLGHKTMQFREEYEHFREICYFHFQSSSAVEVGTSSETLVSHYQNIRCHNII